jgi:hypothetical protein
MNKWCTPVLFLCSLAIGGILFFFSLRRASQAPGRGRSESYAVLALEEGVPDREAAEVLEKALGRPVVSESSQWVFLNSFEGLERIPLEEYEGRLEAFDPRRDGYADKLKDFFVRGGKRWFFIPLDQGIRGLPPFSDPADRFKKRLNAALDTVPPSFTAPGSLSGGPEAFLLRLEPRGRPAGLGIILFVSAWTAAVIFPAGYRRPEPRQGKTPGEGGFRPRRFRGFPAGIPAERRRLLLLAPAMLPLSLWGAPGFAFLALFLFLGALLADPVKERWVRLLGKKTFPPVRRRPGFYRFLRCLSLGLPAAFILWFGGASPLWGSLNFLGLSLLYVCSLGIETRRNFPPPPRGGGPPYSPCRFVPLPILPPRRTGLRDSPFPAAAELLKPGAGDRGPKKDGLSLVLPFALASCLAAFFGAPGRDFRPQGRLPPDWIPPVTEEDYRAHVLFQTGFTRRPLQYPEAGDPRFPDPGYFRYTLGEDGLVERSLPTPEETEDWEIPPFPLAELSGFLTAWESRESSGTGGAAVSRRGPAGDMVFPLLALLLVFPSLIGGGRGRKKLSPYYDKRIAA